MDSTSTANSTDPLSSAYPEVFQQVYRKVAIGVTAVGLICSVLMFPFGAVLLKYRTNYLPKETNVDQEEDKGESHQYVRPTVNSYFGTFHRVLRVEKWSGLYKGIMPSLIKYLFIYCAGLFLMMSRDPQEASPRPGIKSQLLTYLFGMTFSLPITIIINRAITTQHNLPWFGPCHSLRILLTEEERHRPWLLYFTPGLFVTDYAFEVYSVLLSRTITAKFFTRNVSDASVADPWRKLVRFCASLGYSVFTTTIECLYNNVFARLSVQRSQPVSTSISTENPLQEKETNLLHDTDRPYVGAFDCVRRIINEEGYSALFRAWWCDFVLKLWWLPFVK